MQRFFSLFMTVLTVSFLFAMTAGQATTYRVSLAAPATASTQIIHDTAWMCDGTECATQSARSGVANTCARIVRELGAVTAFMVDGEAVSQDQLTECNARAR